MKWEISPPKDIAEQLAKYPNNPIEATLKGTNMRLYVMAEHVVELSDHEIEEVNQGIDEVARGEVLDLDIESIIKDAKDDHHKRKQK